MSRKTQIKIGVISVISILTIVQVYIRNVFGGTPHCKDSVCPAVFGIDPQVFDWGVLAVYILIVVILWLSYLIYTTDVKK